MEGSGLQTPGNNGMGEMSELPNAPQAAAAATSIPFPADAPWTWKETIPDDAELRKLGGDVVADEPCHLGHAESLSWKKSLGERMAALQQLVSPFGKTDTACILYEALDYIRFLHGQVQALSSPYMHRPPSSMPCVPLPATAVEPSDLRSRGLCLVPISRTDCVAGADVCSLVAAMGLAAAEEEDKEAAPATLIIIPGNRSN